MTWRRAFVALLCLAAGLGVPRPEAGAAAVQAALVFVHAGRSLAALAPLYALRRPLGLGILPRQPYSVEISKDAPAHGVEPLLDVPIGGAGGVDAVAAPGPAPRDGEIRRGVLDDFFSAPGVVGMRLDVEAQTAPDEPAVRDVLEVARARGVWFLDAPGGSAGAGIARTLGVPALVATDEIDASPAPDAIASRVRALIERARTTGQAIGVARLDGPALAVVARLLPAFDRAGVVLVPPSALLR
ncbi:MAG TPA: divergent polysaccharide deacetylase family protein [bacterium]|nr:divergent polysaccharide deacetylase family protein [bacterium]